MNAAGALPWVTLAEQQHWVEQVAAHQADRVERDLRQKMGEGARGGRQEPALNFANFQEAVTRQGAEARASILRLRALSASRSNLPALRSWVMARWCHGFVIG